MNYLNGEGTKYKNLWYLTFPLFFLKAAPLFETGIEDLNCKRKQRALSIIYTMKSPKLFCHESVLIPFLPCSFLTFNMYSVIAFFLFSFLFLVIKHDHVSYFSLNWKKQCLKIKQHSWNETMCKIVFRYFFCTLPL